MFGYPARMDPMDEGPDGSTNMSLSGIIVGVFFIAFVVW